MRISYEGHNKEWICAEYNSTRIDSEVDGCEDNRRLSKTCDERR